MCHLQGGASALPGVSRAQGEVSIWLGLEGDDSVHEAQGRLRTYRQEGRRPVHVTEQNSTAGTVHNSISHWHETIPRWLRIFKMRSKVTRRGRCALAGWGSCCGVSPHPDLLLIRRGVSIYWDPVWFSWAIMSTFSLKLSRKNEHLRDPLEVIGIYLKGGCNSLETFTEAYSMQRTF